MSGRFKRATKKTSRLRMAIDGPAGSGKTFTALRFAFALGQRVAVVDTERGSASKYHGESPDGVPFEFDVLELSTYSPTEYVSAIDEAGRSGYDVLIIDSLSHAWEGVGGALDLVDRKQSGDSRANSFTAWKDVTPLHRKMVDSILSCPAHVIATMRSKVEFVMEETISSSGRKIMVPRRVGMAPVQRSGMEYEFDIYGSMDHTHTLTISKSRCSRVSDAIVTNPGANWIAPVAEWLSDGVPADVPTPTVTQDSLAEEFRRLTAGMNSEILKQRLEATYGRAEFAALNPDQQAEVIAKLRSIRTK